MRDKKCWKRLMAFVLTGMMLFPASSVRAKEGQMMEEGSGQQEEEVYAGGDETNGDGFQVEDGALVKYTGNDTEVVIPDGVTEIDEDAFSGCNSFTIYGKAGSYAETYAEENDIPFSTEAMPEFKDISDCSILLSQTSYDYDGKAKEPEVTVKDNGKTLAEGTDYTVEYKDNVEGGTAHAVITGKGGYLGSQDVEFIIMFQNFKIEDGVLISYTGNAEDVVIPDTVKEIRGSFPTYGKMKSVAIPSSVKTICNNSFGGCTNLTTITVSADNENYSSEDGCLYNKDKTKLIICPCGKTEINMSESIKEIGSNAFLSCSMESVILPDGVIKIDDSAFSNCSRLGGIYIPASVKEIAAWAFDGCKGLTIYGKSGSYAETYAKENNIPFSSETMPGPGTSRNLSDCQIILAQDPCIYNGGEQKPAVVVKNGTHILKEKEEYTVTYQNNVNVGTAAITLTGTGDYAGTVTKTFTIKNGEPIQVSTGNGTMNLYRITVWDVLCDSNGVEWYRKSRSIGAASWAVDGSHYRFTAKPEKDWKLLSEEVQEGRINGGDAVVIFKYEETNGFIGWGGTGGDVTYGSLCYDLYACTESGSPIDGISIYKEGYLDLNGDELEFYADDCQFASDGTYIINSHGSIEGWRFSWIKSSSTVNGYAKLMYQKENEDGTITQYIPRDYPRGGRQVIDDNGQEGTDEYGNSLGRVYRSGLTCDEEGNYQADYKVSVLDADGNKIGDVAVEPPKNADIWRISPEVDLTYRIENLAKGWELTVKFSQTEEFFENPVAGKKATFRIPRALVSITATKLSDKKDDSSDKKDHSSENLANPQPQTLSCAKEYNKKYGDKPFALNAKLAKGNGRLTYTSSDKKVAIVDKNSGKVTIKGTGTAIITVKAGATTDYKETAAQILIKVSPAKLKAPSLKLKNGRKLKVSWKRDKTATGYEIQYSTDKKFKNKKTTKTVTVKKNKTVSKTISKLTKNKNYYVRIRAYKNAKINGKTQKLCGAWSSAKRSGRI